MIIECFVCGAELSPWVAAMCHSCQFSVPSNWYMGNPDAGVRILERSPGPLNIYDVQRGIRREFGWNVQRGSLAVSISADLRFCWAGKGLYGLYRHKLIPGPRNLAGIAKFFLYSWGDWASPQELAFVMTNVGYRFQGPFLALSLPN